MPVNPPTLAVVIVTHNSRAEIGECLSSVLGVTSAETTQVVVVDNASIDGTPDLVRHRFAPVKEIDAGRNVGFARANNNGAASAPGAASVLAASARERRARASTRRASEPVPK